jgi:DNA-binding MarR family transcriptional regulator
MAVARWLDETESRAWRGLVQMTELLRAQLARELQRDTGLSDADYVVLVQLSEAEGRRMRMYELARRLLWSKSRLSHQVARMEERRMVCREGCPSDARGAFAVLTAEGLHAVERAAPDHVESVRRHLIDHLTRDQVAALADVSETVLEHLNVVQTEAPGGACCPPA